MADGRFVSKSICTDYELNCVVSFEADYLYNKCIPHLDRDGRMTGHPGEVKALACPLRTNMTPEVVDRCLGELAAARLVLWYEVDGRPALWFKGFKPHQKGLRYEREGESKLPSEHSPTLKRLTTLLRTNSESGGSTPAEVNGMEWNGITNSGRSLAIESDLPPVPEPSSHTVASVTMEAHRVLGMEQWGGELTAKYRETRSIIDRHWLGRGVQLDSVYRAIHGLRTMVDNGEVEWLADRRGKPIDGLEVLLKSAVVPGPDGPQMRPLFQLAQEAYARPGPPSRTASTGPVNVGSVLANLKAQGSRT